MIDNKMTITLLIINVGLLVYNGWQKITHSGCTSCNITQFSDKTIAIVGIIVSLLVIILVYYSSSRNYLKYVAFVITGACSAFSSFLLASQLTLAHEICIVCIASSIIFALVFFILGYQVLVANLLKSLDIT